MMEGAITGNCKGEEEEEETRIYVGGLGEKVTSEDLHKIWLSLGSVKGVDLIRTKARSFAYIDFLPSSHKSLSKLFSTYNGCVWKGGRLRLEKAKENYLVRLRREWAKDAELASTEPTGDVDGDKSRASSEKPKKVLNSEKEQLRIFFPRLRKVKSLPFSGSGKHKYSFQRVEVPPLPVHFCDCEEHSVTSHTTKDKQICDLETQSGGINEEELNIMKSVMNKLFERENVPNAACSEIGVTQEGDNSIISNDDLQFDENEVDDATDEDNLIINMVTRGNNKTAFSEGRERETILANQESRLNERKASKDGPTQNVLRVQKRNISSPMKKRKALLNEESNKKEILSAITGGKGKLQTHSTASGTLLGAQTVIPESGIKQSTTSSSWSQKSSWRELVGDRGKSAFSMSHILPGIASTKEEQPISDGQIVQDHTDSENLKFIKHGNLEGQSSQFLEEQPRSDGQIVQDHTDSENLKFIKHGNLEGQSSKSEEPGGLAEAQPSKSDAVLNKSGRGVSWLKKSTWTELVSENNSSFSISQILPGISCEKQDPPEFNGVAVLNSTDSKHSNVVKRDRSESAGDGSEVLGIGKEGLLSAPGSSNMVTLNKKLKLAGMVVVHSAPENNLQTVTDNNEASALVLERECNSALKRTSIGDVGIGETCSFMRSAASLREWTKTKASLSGSLKRKSNEK